MPGVFHRAVVVGPAIPASARATGRRCRPSGAPDSARRRGRPFRRGAEPSTPRGVAPSFRCVRAGDASQLGDTMTILPGAGGYWFEGNEVGCLLLHGFTGTPQNVRPLADYLARRGLAVAAPRMPGHGTTAADLDKTGPEEWLGAAEQALADLRSRCSTVFVAGISMGGTITLELARRHPDLPGIVVMAAPVLPLDALEPLVSDPNRPASIPAPW